MFSFIALIFAVVIIAAELVTIFSPLVVYGATYVVKKLLPNVAGWVVLMLIVPLLSLAVAWITELIANPDLTFWAQFAYGLLAVFVNELFKQLKPASADKL